MRSAVKTGLALTLAAALLAPSIASALTRMPTGKTLVKPTKELIVKELNKRFPSRMCIPPYNINQVKITSKAVKSTAGDVVRSVKWQALHSPAFYGGHKGTCKITATIAPACGIDIKMDSFKPNAFWPKR